MHNIMHVSLSAGKQLHLWIRPLSKLGEPNYTIWQLFADLPKTIWWSQSSCSWAGVRFVENISAICVGGRLGSSPSRQPRARLALRRLFSPCPWGWSPQAGRTDWECLEWWSAPTQGRKRRAWISQSSQTSPQIVGSTESNRKSKNYVG